VKKALFLSILLAFASCSSIDRLDKNLEVSIQTVQENTQAVNKSSQTIAENTQTIDKTTATIEKLMKGPAFFLLFFVFTLVGLFVVFLFALISLREIQKRLDHLIHKK
jgi:nitrogen fixation/metabolism regulation signal transduction histidine kinase